MELYTSYSVKIKHYNAIFNDTVTVYRNAVDFFIGVALKEWEQIALIKGNVNRQSFVESLTNETKAHPQVPYSFAKKDKAFYKFPSYLRRAAISEALGKVSSYKSNLANWEQKDPLIRGKKPTVKGAGYTYPAMYRDNMFVRTGTYTASIKVYIRNTWDWLPVELKKSDVDYILRHCKDRTERVPTLQKRGKEWFLDFAFTESVTLPVLDIQNSRILAVDLGINNACVCSVMQKDGTVLGRKFLSLPKEKDCLNTAINRIKKAQQHGAKSTPHLWAVAKGVNDDIAVKTVKFIMDIAILYDVDVIVFEHLDLQGKKKGSKKQKLHLWKAKYVQSMVSLRAHRNKIRISHVNAWKTSKLAFDGSGEVERGVYIQNGVEKYNYSICTFPNGKQYNCDLNASYNIGARYYIRELIKSLPETARLDALAKVPECAKRSTCTLSSLIRLHAVLVA